jgi:hypothetical protein
MNLSVYDQDEAQVYLSAYARVFVENKMGKKIEILLQKLNQFIDWNSGNLAQVKNIETSFYNKVLYVLKSEEVHRFYSRSLEEAKKDLFKYRAYYKFVFNMTELMEPSGIGFRESLKSQGIPEDAAVEIYPLVKDYWSKTYGKIRNNFIIIGQHLKEMATHLENQINIEEELEEVNFYEGFDKASHLSAVFKLELKSFQELVKSVESVMPNAKEVRSMVRAQIRLLKADLKVHYSGARKNLQIAGEAKSKTVKAVMVLMFLVGVYNLYRGMKSKLVKKGFVHGMKIALERKGVSASNDSAVKFKEDITDVVTREFPNPPLITLAIKQLDLLYDST